MTTTKGVNQENEKHKTWGHGDPPYVEVEVKGHLQDDSDGFHGATAGHPWWTAEGCLPADASRVMKGHHKVTAGTPRVTLKGRHRVTAMDQTWGAPVSRP